MSIAPRLLLATCAALSLVLSACGGASGNASTPVSPTPAPTVTATPPVATTTVEYSGIFASGMFTGRVTMSAAVPVGMSASGTSTWRPMAIAAATGTARFSGATQNTVNLSGTYDTTSRQFNLRGGAFAVDATVNDDVVTGTIATGAGVGGLSAMRTSEGTATTAYCGTFSGTESGKLLIVVRGGLVSGVAAQDGEPGGITLAGSVTGSTISIGWSWSEGSGGRGTATGTINATTASGSWSNTDGQRGGWSAGTGC